MPTRQTVPFAQHKDDLSKQVTLRTRVMILTYSVALFLFLFDLFRVPGLQPGGGLYYALLFIGLSAGFWLNKRGFAVISSIITLFVLNLVVFIFSLTIQELLLLFIPIAILSLVLFPAGARVWRWGFLVLSYVLLTVSYFSDITVLPTTRVDEPERFIIFFVCATATIVSLVMIVHFYMSLSYASEKTLRDNQQRLLKLADDLQKSHARFELVIKGSRAGIYEWNVIRNTIYVSREWKQILGFDDDDIKDITINDLADLMHPDDRKELQQKIQEHFRTQKPFQNESRRRHKNGSYRWIFDSGLSTTDEQGNVEVVVGSIIDITDRKNAEQQVLDQNELLKKANLELDRFVYNASHDLRSPLSSILALLSIAERTSSVDEIRMYHEMIGERIKRLDTFITDVLDYSRNSRHEIVRKDVALASLIDEIVQPYLEEQTLISVTHHTPEGLTIDTDPTRLKIILNNLIGNAIKYHDIRKAKPFVRVRCLMENGYCRISVEDNGIGIEPEHLEKVFDMFYRATQQSKGSGLGLFIAKEIVEKLGGTILLSSTHMSGTQVDISLPA